MRNNIIKVVISLAVLGLCVYAIWPKTAAEKENIAIAYDAIDWRAFAPYLLAYLVTLAVVQFCRSYRWKYLLRATGHSASLGQLLAVNAVGFMAILILPIRLGEFVRPALFKRYTGLSASSGLGTVAVERVMDGLLVSTFVFVTCFYLHSETSPDWMMPTAILALAVFGGAMVFLIGALVAPTLTAKVAVYCTLTPWLAPTFAEKIGGFVTRLIAGFQILKDLRNLLPFVFWTAAYWLANGLGMWIAARGIGIEISLLGAYATMGLLAVGMMVPNAPGMAGQFQAFIILGLQLFIGLDLAKSIGFIYGVVIHIVQFIWYIAVALVFLRTSLVSLSDIWEARHDSSKTDVSTTAAADQ